MPTTSAGPRAAYLDSSALLKLIIPERESLALRTAIVGEAWELLVSSQLAHTEVLRTATAIDPSAAVERRARAMLAETVLLDVSREILDDAVSVRPRLVRSLDAIHIATAARVVAGSEPLLPAGAAVLVTYDKRMFRAWHDRRSVPVRAPGAPLDRER